MSLTHEKRRLELLRRISQELASTRNPREAAVRALQLIGDARSAVEERACSRQALRRLVGSAVKYTAVGGGITVGAEIDDRLMRANAQDTGAGIPPEDLPTIFDRFNRVHTEAAPDFSLTAPLLSHAAPRPSR